MFLCNNLSTGFGDVDNIAEWAGNRRTQKFLSQFSYLVYMQISVYTEKTQNEMNEVLCRVMSVQARNKWHSYFLLHI